MDFPNKKTSRRSFLAMLGIALASLGFGRGHKRRQTVVSAIAARGIASMASANVLIQGRGLWKPDPPASYPSTSGTIAMTQLEQAIGGTGNGIGQQTFHPNWNHCVQTPDGTIIVAYNFYDNLDHQTTKYRVKKSTDGGASFTTLRDGEAIGDLLYGMPPAVEMDSNGNVYVILDQYYQSNPRHTRIIKWAPPYTGTGTVLNDYGDGSNKWSAFLDQFRNWIWACYWQANTNNLVAFDLAGNVVKQVTVFDPVLPAPELYANASYPCLYVNKDGGLYVGYTAESSSWIGRQSYYGCGYIYSPDGGDNFYGPNGLLSLPIVVDWTGAPNKTAFFWPHTGTDFKPGSDASYGPTTNNFDWNHLNQFLVNNNKLHINYQSGDNACFGGEHHPYVRFDLATHAIDYRREPDFDSDAGYQMQPNNAASLSQGTDMGRRIYYIAGARSPNLGKVAVFYCDNPDAATPVWNLYAVSSLFAGAFSLVNPVACRFVNTDGSIIGLVQSSDTTAPNNYPVYFFKVTPV